MKAKDLDKMFDSGKVDITPYLDFESIAHPGYAQKRVNVDFPEWMVKKIDQAAHQLGVPRQSLIKVWIAERLKENKNIL